VVGPLSGDFELFDRVPASALLAVSVSNLDERWAEIRGTPALANLQDALLSRRGVAADLIPLLAGRRSVFFLAPADRWPFAVPVAILQPPDVRKARAILGSMPDVAYLEGDGVLWVGPALSVDLLAQLAREQGPRFPEAVPLTEIANRLPAGGLVRGCVNSGALLRMLRGPAIESCPYLLRGPAAGLAAELSAVRYAAFRRDFVDGEFRSDGLVAYDRNRLPAEVAGILDPGARPVAIPSAASLLRMPDGSDQVPFMVMAFRPESRAWMPWIRYVAASDPHGPLRNIAFWLEEFEHRYGRHLERDLFEVFGDRAWLLATRSENQNSMQVVLVMELSARTAIEGTLQDLFSWAGEQLWLSSFGILSTRSWEEHQPGRLMSGLTLRTPLSSLKGPAFEVDDRYLVVALQPSGLATGRAWIESLKSEPPQEAGGSSHATILVEPSQLASLIKTFRPAASSESDRLLWDAVLGLMADSKTLQVDMKYEPDAITFQGRLRVGD